MKYKKRLRVALAVVAAVALAIGGFFLYTRYWSLNFHTVVQGQLYRSAHPTPDALRKWIPKYHIKTVLHLGGGNEDEERKVVEEMGANIAFLKLSADDLPTRQRLLGLIQLLETSPRPMLLHCLAGADRSGVASVLGAMAIGGSDYASARGQLSVRFLHVDWRDDHIGGVFTQYEDYCRGKGLGTAGWEQFKAWATNVYRVREAPATAPAASRPATLPAMRAAMVPAATLGGRSAP